MKGRLIAVAVTAASAGLAVAAVAEAGSTKAPNPPMVIVGGEVNTSIPSGPAPEIPGMPNKHRRPVGAVDNHTQTTGTIVTVE